MPPFRFSLAQLFWRVTVFCVVMAIAGWNWLGLVVAVPAVLGPQAAFSQKAPRRMLIVLIVMSAYYLLLSLLVLNAWPIHDQYAPGTAILFSWAIAIQLSILSGELGTMASRRRG